MKMKFKTHFMKKMYNHEGLPKLGNERLWLSGKWKQASNVASSRECQTARILEIWKCFVQH
jgi:hypothetical protein